MVDTSVHFGAYSNQLFHMISFFARKVSKNNNFYNYLTQSISESGIPFTLLRRRIIANYSNPFLKGESLSMRRYPSFTLAVAAVDLVFIWKTREKSTCLLLGCRAVSILANDMDMLLVKKRLNFGKGKENLFNTQNYSDINIENRENSKAPQRCHLPSPKVNGK